jgi:hypothetical protein
MCRPHRLIRQPRSQVPIPMTRMRQKRSPISRRGYHPDILLISHPPAITVAVHKASPPSLPPRLPPRASLPPPSSPPPIDILRDLPPDDIPESAPPAYSVTPDIGGGETVVEQGPRRPFQRAPAPFVQPPPPAAYPPLGPPGSYPERPLSQLSDRGAPPPASQPRYAPPPGPPPSSAPVQQPRYAPPPGPPPPSRPRAASTSSGAGSTAPPTSDGYPTSTPTPGHPLLRNGRTLVYPESYFCHKCKHASYPLTHARQ